MTNNGSNENVEKRSFIKTWYKDKTILFIIAVFTFSGCLLLLKAEIQTDNAIHSINEGQLLFGNNQTLKGISKAIVVINKTVAMINNSEDTKVISSLNTTNQQLSDISKQLKNVSNILANPNRTVNVRPN